MAEIHQRGDAETGIGDTTRNDRRKMTEIRLDIDGDAVERHPPLQSHADRGDLVLIALTLVRSLDPDTDPILAPFAANVEGGKGADDPFLESRDIGADIRAALLEVEHHIGHTLAGSVIGYLAAASGRKQGEAGREQIAGL